MKNWLFLFLIACSSTVLASSEEEEDLLKQSVGEYLMQNAYSIHFDNEEAFQSDLLEMEAFVLAQTQADIPLGALIPFLEEEVENFFALSAYSEEGMRFFPFFGDEMAPTAESTFSCISMNGWGDSAGSDPKPKTPEAEPFFSLSLLNEDKKNIRKLITTMSDKNIVQLLLDIKSMTKVGDKIRRVHPLRFIGFILADPYLKRCLKSIEGDSIKWNNFIEGYNERMQKEAKEGNLEEYLPGFSELLRANPSDIQAFIQSEDYIGLVRFYLNK